MEKLGMNDMENQIRSSRVVMLDFWSPGCVPCKNASAEVEELAAEASSAGLSVQAFGVNIAEEPEVAREYQVLGVPTVIILREGKEIARFTSTIKKEKVRKFLE
jgi:thioredoxin 1